MMLGVYIKSVPIWFNKVWFSYPLDRWLSDKTISIEQ